MIDIDVTICLLVIYNYDRRSEYDLQLSVGDTVQIKERFSGNAIVFYVHFPDKRRH